MEKSVLFHYEYSYCNHHEKSGQVPARRSFSVAAHKPHMHILALSEFVPFSVTEDAATPAVPTSPPRATRTASICIPVCDGNIPGAGHRRRGRFSESSARKLLPNSAPLPPDILAMPAGGMGNERGQRCEL